jgi:hypothetical protein
LKHSPNTPAQFLRFHGAVVKRNFFGREPAIAWRGAPYTRHRAVDGVHSIDFAGDKRTCFLLTLKMKGVKTNSFFDSFLSFSGWRSVRGSSEVTLCIAK